MARPKKDNAEYHSHDSDMRNNKKIKALRKKFSHLGYSIYNMILEVLTDAEHFRHLWNDLNIELLAGDFDVDRDELIEIVNYCIKLQLLTIESEFLFCNEHINRFSRLLSKRKRDNNDVSGNLTAGNNDKVGLPAVIGVENPQSKVKYSKVEESKVVTAVGTVPKDSITQKIVSVEPNAGASGSAPAKNSLKKEKRKARDLPNSPQEINTYLFEKMKTIWPAKKILLESDTIWNHYTANGWVQAKGKPIISWKHAVNKWILKDFDGTLGSASENNTQATVITHPSTPKPPQELDLTDEQKDSLSKSFIEDCFADFLNGVSLAGEMFSGFYPRLVKDGLLILSDADKERIKKQAQNDEKKSKKIAVTEYFEKLKNDGIGTVYRTKENEKKLQIA